MYMYIYIYIKNTCVCVCKNALNRTLHINVGALHHNRKEKETLRSFKKGIVNLKCLP